MRNLLLQLHAVLTSDSQLTAIVQSENIGASIRQNAGSPALEYGIDGDSPDASGHRFVSLVLYAHSATGADVVYQIRERLEALLTAKNLSMPVPPSVTPLTFAVAQSRLVDTAVAPRNPWAHSLRIEFSIQVADKRPFTQKQ